jgi:hypothetical protein
MIEYTLSDNLKPKKLLAGALIVMIFVIGSIVVVKPSIFPLPQLSQPYIEGYTVPPEQPVEIDAAPPIIVPANIHSVELTRAGRRRIGNLIDLKDVTAAEAIRLRGGGQSQVNELQTGYGELTVGELANMAAAGDVEADRAVKMVKQANKKAQKYGGK